MDREQYHRVVEDDITQLIDNWHVCPYSDKVDDLFATFESCTIAYLKNRTLTTPIIVNIVKDLRSFLNPQRNVNMYYFTDKICDAILVRFHGLTPEGQEEFSKYVQECLLRVYTRA